MRYLTESNDSRLPGPPSHEYASKFEEGLFRDGVYIFDPKKYRLGTEKLLNKLEDWYRSSVHWEADLLEERMQEHFEYADHLMIWSAGFSGHIPRHWEYSTDHIITDLKEALKVKETMRASVILSETLIDAGITHPHPSVNAAAGKVQRLTFKHLVWLFANPSIEPWSRNEILRAQEKFGVTPDSDELKQARIMAFRLKEEIARKKRAG